MRQECGTKYQTLWMVRVYCCVICGWYIYADVYCVTGAHVRADGTCELHVGGICVLCFV